MERTIVYALRMVNLLNLNQFIFRVFFIAAACGYCPFTSCINFLFRVPEEEFLKAFKLNHHFKTKVNNFHRQMAKVRKPDEDFVAIRPEWTTVHRILACRFTYSLYFSLLAYMKNNMR